METLPVHRPACLEALQEVKKTYTYTLPVQVSPTVDTVFVSDPRVIRNMIKDEEIALKLLTCYCNTLQSDLEPHMRSIVTDWMLEVCEDHGAKDEVFLQAVHYMDSFLSTTVIKKSQFQQVAASCLLLASKYVDENPLSGMKLIAYTDQSITLQQLLDWEWQVMASCKWQLGVPNAISFLQQLVPRLAFLSTLPPHLLDTMTRHAHNLAIMNQRPQPIQNFRIFCIKI